MQIEPRFGRWHRGGHSAELGVAKKDEPYRPKASSGEHPNERAPSARAEQSETFTGRSVDGAEFRICEVASRTRSTRPLSTR